jgi:hypothetical protein
LLLFVPHSLTLLVLSGLLPLPVLLMLGFQLGLLSPVRMLLARLGLLLCG